LLLPRFTSHLSRAATSLLRAAVAALIAALLLLTTAQQVAEVGPWWLELSRYLPYPALLGPAVLALIASLWLGWRWRVAALAALAAVLVVAMGWVHGRPDAGGRPLRLMTYNIKAYKASLRPGGYDAVAAEVAAHRPDIVVAQDAHGASPAQAARLWPGGSAFGLPHSFAVEQYIVASRYPLLGCAPGRIDYRGQAHLYVRCTVDVDGHPLDLVTAHFESPRNGLNAARREGFEGVDDWRQNFEDRLGQARALARGLARAERPLVIAGDLNAPESSSVIRTLLALDLRDAFSSAGRGYGYSYGHALRLGFSFLRIDHILVSPQIGVADVFVGGASASEHRPVIADLLMDDSRP
jgi:vancomycin resistance protein VanJ